MAACFFLAPIAASVSGVVAALLVTRLSGGTAWLQSRERPALSSTSAFMYAKGEGVPENYAEAYFWLILAKANGSPQAGGDAEILKSHLTLKDVSKAQRRAAEWFEAHSQRP